MALDTIYLGLEDVLFSFSNFIWGIPLVALLVGSGIMFALYSRFRPYKYLPHAFNVLIGKYDSQTDKGQISHFQALATALSGTIGLGNIVGVALGISVGGPGVLFWMWVTALVGMITKFYTCSLSIMYRGRDSLGVIQGGPMYVIREGLSRKWLPLAWLFAFAGVCGSLPVFQVNQLVQILKDVFLNSGSHATTTGDLWFSLSVGVIVGIVVLTIILGKIQRVGFFSAKIMPCIVLVYLIMTIGLLVKFYEKVPMAFSLILNEAFSGEAVMGGGLISVILIGVRRGAISNEAGIGTESMAHGAARTNEPIREGLVAMFGPIIDTFLVCTCTGLAIIVTDSWKLNLSGISVTTSAFELAYPGYGAILLMLVVIFFSISTMTTFWYYGTKCLGFLVGAKHQFHYTWLYFILIIVGSVSTLNIVLGLIDSMYALMAIPTMVSTIFLAKKVNQEFYRYKDKYLRHDFQNNIICDVKN
tara:strand:- start:5888 stop:7306 length:1419 start_codon:yes stop_codon:yes gene_type:complete